jgi:hypothetical protein
MLRKPEICQFKDMALQEDVLWLEVHVSDVLRAQELESERKLLKESAAD